MVSTTRSKYELEYFVSVTTFLSLATVVMGHGRLIDPPSRSSAYRFGFGTPRNDNDHQLSCGGFWNQWGRNQGRCGVCGDPYQGPRENEAGGKYATGTIVRHYREGQQITVVIDMTVGHGGFSEFRICPNNDVHKAITQQCLDQHLLATPSGETRIEHGHVTGLLRYKLKLPRGLTCTQCVLQWKWNTASNNNCNYVTHENCCEGCGPQEQFYGCADVSIGHDSNAGRYTTRRTTKIPFKPNIFGHTQPSGFIPIDIFGRELKEPN
ncbi:uncharacterized protein LOC128549609 isoform X2 [Mercenaria mercenaria]|uniref:uncharacterized protein LOC128549609 isoform X2 n=1 Tax=Mercenaria mercenaria TaxID=6596 RepID=UPI00234F73B4|nr:uncharacterized protein LOC128549609 isoform X2 [Mercenaria mercenaria]